jgi:hypothetical protein
MDCILFDINDIKNNDMSALETLADAIWFIFMLFWRYERGKGSVERPV